MIVFFEKAMITGLSLQKKLRTYKKKAKKKTKKKKKKKTTSKLSSVSRAWTPPPPPHTHTHTAKPDESFLDPRMDIRYRGGRETISLLKNFYSAAKI